MKKSIAPKRTALALIILLLAVLALGNLPFGNTTVTRAAEVQEGQAKVEVVLERLECDKTTEAGADEVYILVAGKNSDGTKTFSDRLPTNNPRVASGHWDMNDSGQAADNPSGDPRHITNQT